MRFIIRWFSTVLALFVAAWLVSGIEVQGNAWVVFAAVALILGLLNALVRPLLKLITCLPIILTLGLFILVINAFVLWLSAGLARSIFHVGFYVNGFWAAFWGGLIVGIVSAIIGAILGEKRKEHDGD